MKKYASASIQFLRLFRNEKFIHLLKTFTVDVDVARINSRADSADVGCRTQPQHTLN